MQDDACSNVHVEGGGSISILRYSYKPRTCRGVFRVQTQRFISHDEHGIARKTSFMLHVNSIITNFNSNKLSTDSPDMLYTIIKSVKSDDLESSILQCTCQLFWYITIRVVLIKIELRLIEYENLVAPKGIGCEKKRFYISFLGNISNQ